MSILKPFWTYFAIAQGGWKAVRLEQEIAINVLMMIPFGVLFPILVEKHKLRRTLLYGAGFSILIEVLQYASKRGYFEFDDIMHNTVGVLIGVLLYKGIEYAITTHHRRRNLCN